MERLGTYEKFESFVNSERCKTPVILSVATNGLRVLLIQKDVKQYYDILNT